MASAASGAGAGPWSPPAGARAGDKLRPSEPELKPGHGEKRVSMDWGLPPPPGTQVTGVSPG